MAMILKISNISVDVSQTNFFNALFSYYNSYLKKKQVYSIYSKKRNQFSVKVNFDPYNYHPKQDMEHFHHPRNALHALFSSVTSSLPVSAFYHCEVSIAYSWKSYKQNTTVYIILCLPSFTQNNGF